MYFVDKILAQGTRQRKIPLPKKFWLEFPLDSFVKISHLDNSPLFFVDLVQEQGKLQRRIPVPQKFWKEFPMGSLVKVELLKRAGPTIKQNSNHLLSNSSNSSNGNRKKR
jgi:hypothetical protein